MSMLKVKDLKVNYGGIEALKGIGLDTAKAVLRVPRENLINEADLEEDTVDYVLSVLRTEFED